MPSIQSLLNSARLPDSPTARLDAELLLSSVIAKSRIQLISENREVVSPDDVARFQALLARRAMHEPVAYLTGEREFFGLPFTVSSAVLIPRPETEMLVERVLQLVATERRGTTVRLIDVGTGSGCIAVALAYELRRLGIAAEITALDRDAAALGVARANVERHGLASAVRLMQSDWLSALGPEESGFDAIISNPPYIADGDPAVGAEVHFEPAGALYSGPDGLTGIRELIPAALARLKPGGYFLCEIGHAQREGLHRFCSGAFERSGRTAKIAFWRDLAGLDRVLELQT